MEKSGSANPAQFNAALKATSYDGITGKIAFNEQGDLKSPSSTLYQVKNVAWVPVTTRTAD
jgi:branched-chain amino acid transport system substrate-binding protein